MEMTLPSMMSLGKYYRAVYTGQYTQGSIHRAVDAVQ